MIFFLTAVLVTVLLWQSEHAVLQVVC